MSEQGDYECTLSPELLAKAEDELNEKQKWRKRDIQALRDMVIAHKGLKCPTDDAFLLKFLRAKKFDYDRSYKQLLKYFETRAVHPYVFKDFKPSAIKHVLDAGVTIVLPKRDKHGRRVLLFRPGLWDPEKYPIYDNFKGNIMGLEKIICEEETQVTGIVFVMDPSGMTMGHAKAFEPGYAKLFSGFIQDAFPARLKGIRIINEPAIFSYIFAIMKPLLKEKMRNRLKFFGSDLAALREDLGDECLPEEYGGRAGPLANILEEWKAILYASDPYFEEMQTYSLEVPREIIKQKNEEAVEGLTGTYKKLSVD